MGGYLLEKASTKTNSKRVMTVQEVAQYLRLSQAKVYRLAQAGEIPAMRIGKSWRFRKDLIDEWFDKQVKKGLETYDEG